MKIKSLICALLFLLTTILLLPQQTYATDRVIVTDGLKFSDSQNKSSWSDGVYTATGAGGRASAKTNTITITNTSKNNKK